MYTKKNKCSVLVFLFGCLLLTAVTQAARPILVWNFEEGSGSVAQDGSGNGRVGTIPFSVTRQAGGARGQGSCLDFSGAYVEETTAPDYLNGLETLTCSIWCKSNFTAVDQGCFGFTNVGPDQGGIRYDQTGWRGGAPSVIKASLMTTNGEIGFEGSAGMQITEWQHLTMVWKSGEGLSLYIDGEPDTPTNYDGSRDGAVAEVLFLRVGVGAMGNTWDGLLDEMIIYDVALSAAEIKELYSNGLGDALTQPGMVSPQNNRGIEETSVTLTWLPGSTAVSHNVYFSEDYDAVSEREAGALVLETSNMTTHQIDDLERAKEYYWRVDAVQSDGSVIATDVWRFSVKDIKAYGPSPSDGGAYVSPAQMLSWEFGVGSWADIVYIGTDANEVAQATGGTSQVDPNYTPDTPFAEGTIYYWRVDEVNETGDIVTGDVWSFTTVPSIPIEDESLRGWWTFDEEDTSSAVDWSGHGLHGILTNGTPKWVPGPQNLAMICSGTYYVTPAPDVNATSGTISAWVKPTGTSNRGAVLTMGEFGTGLVIWETNHLVGRWGANVYDPILIVPMNEWSFVATVVEPSSTRLYLNSTDWFFEDNAGNSEVVFDSPLWLGAAAGRPEARIYNGVVDDIRFYTRALSNEELEALISAGTPPVEPNDPNIMVIDDFDSYKAYFRQPDPNAWDVWMDGYGGNGTGSTMAHVEEPVMERLIVVDGGQSLPVYYNNTGFGMYYGGNMITATYSEISRAFSPAQDFTLGGATTTMTLWIHGHLDNTVQAGDNVSLELTDGTQTVTLPVVDSAQLTQAKWKKVEIALSGLAVDIAKITELRLIIGSKDSAEAGGSGVVFVDNIVLQR